MCAMMPILRVFSSGTVLAISLYHRKKRRRFNSLLFLLYFYSCLPPVMCKGAIRLGHPMGIFLFLNCRTPIIGRIDKFCSQFLLHRFLAALTRRLDQPTHAQRKTSLGSHFDGPLISPPAHAALTNLHRGAGIFNRFFKNPQGVLFSLCRDDVQRTIENRLRHTFLAPTHDRVNKLSYQLVPIFRVRQDLSFSNFPFARHVALFRSLRSVFGTPLSPFLNPNGIQSSANDVIANAREIFDATSSDKHDRMLLQIVSDAGNIRSHFDSVRESDTGHLSQRRVGLLGCGCVYTRAHPSLLRTTLQRWRGVLASLFLSAFAN